MTPKLREPYETPQTELLLLQVENFCCASEDYDSSTLPDYEVDPFDFSDFLL